MRTPSSAAAPAPALEAGRELSATEALALRMRKQRDLAVALGIGAVLAVLTFQAVTHSRGSFCAFHTVAPYVAPPPVVSFVPVAPGATCPPAVATVPDYAPTGDDAEAKLEGAVGVGQENALWVARWFDDALDRDIAALEARRARE